MPHRKPKTSGGSHCTPVQKNEPVKLADHVNRHWTERTRWIGRHIDSMPVQLDHPVLPVQCRFDWFAGSARSFFWEGGFAKDFGFRCTITGKTVGRFVQRKGASRLFRFIWTNNNFKLSFLRLFLISGYFLFFPRFMGLNKRYFSRKCNLTTNFKINQCYACVMSNTRTLITTHTHTHRHLI